MPGPVCHGGRRDTTTAGTPRHRRVDHEHSDEQTGTAQDDDESRERDMKAVTWQGRHQVSVEEVPDPII